MDQLDDSILTEILAKFTLKDLYTCQNVCRQWYHIVQHILISGYFMGELNIPLHKLLENSKPNEKIIRQYLSEGIKNHEISEMFRFPVESENLELLLGSKYGYYDMVKISLENGTNIHTKDDYSLQFASGNGHLEVTKVLIESGANIHAENDWALRSASR